MKNSLQDRDWEEVIKFYQIFSWKKNNAHSLEGVSKTALKIPILEAIFGHYGQFWA